MFGVPLEEAKRCARNMIDSLAPATGPRSSLSTTEIERIAPLTPASEKLALSSALAGIEAGGDDRPPWWLARGCRGARRATRRANEDVHRVILLSDGGANSGVTDIEEITCSARRLPSAVCRRRRTGWATTSTRR